ncbi:MAG: hypothetical protein QXY18_00595 [Nitrososphaerota archaeon]
MPISNKIHNLKIAIKGFLLGATNIYDMIRYLERKKLCADYMLMLSLMGDMLGYPISSYYRLKLLPYYIPKIQSWKQYFLKERDIIEKLE